MKEHEAEPILRKWKFDPGENLESFVTALLDYMNWSDTVLTCLKICDETEAGLPGHPKIVHFNSAMRILQSRTKGFPQ
jgi:hypothetical protein